MSDAIVIRVAEAADLPAILRIYAQPSVDAGEVLSRDAALALFERFKAYPNYQLYVACRDTQVVGTFALLIMDNLGHMGRQSAIVEDVAVAPQFQRQGIGRVMVNFAIRSAQQSGCYKLTMSAASHRHEAHRFYESLGFERHGYSFRVPLDV